MAKFPIVPILFGGVVRLMIIQSKYSEIFRDRVELNTPLNSLKRAKEGIFLLRNGIDPYDGDIVHEVPIVLVFLSKIYEFAPQFVPLVFVLFDLLTGVLLYKMAKNVIEMKLKEQEIQKKNYAPNTEEIWWHDEDKDNVARNILLVYLFNPLSIFNCAGLTTTVFSNLLFALCLYSLSCKNLFFSLTFLAIETIRNVYPFALISPIIILMKKKTWVSGLKIVVAFIALCGFFTYLNYYLTNSWSFLNGTFGLIFTYDNLQPNVGLFWYFFTEMFDHFRTMFLITFQMNATVLYLIPLSLKIQKEPFLLATILIALMSVFRAYPSFGDVAFYLALTPLWRRSWKYMAHNFIVFCFFIVTLAMMPVLWHLWINAGSANANFYFGATLAFSTGQIFLVTDLLFAYVKREFCLYNGEKIYIKGKEAKIILE